LRDQFRSQSLAKHHSAGRRMPSSSEQLDKVSEASATVHIGHMRDRVDMIVSGNDQRFDVVAFVAILGLVAAQVHGAAKEARRKLSIQAWHLKQLVPKGASVPVTRV
jgi:hypothetical protein